MSTSVLHQEQTSEVDLFVETERTAKAFFAMLLGPPDSATGKPLGCVEMRVFKAGFNGSKIAPATEYPRTFCGWFDDAELYWKACGRLAGASAYLTVNPVHPALVARSYNKLSPTKHATSDSDILALRWLYIDIDPVRPADISSSDVELEQALERRDIILSENPEIAASAEWGCSGNGAWILVRLPDVPNAKEHHAKVAAFLESLRDRYDDEAVKIDVTTKNPSRVMCAIGTMKHKGDQVGDRRHRMVTWDGGRHHGGLL